MRSPAPPEGELLPGAMGPFRPGAFVAAQRARVPVVPVLIEGSGDAWSPGAFVVHGTHVIRITVLDPIGADQVAEVPVERLVELARTRIEEARSTPP